MDERTGPVSGHESTSEIRRDIARTQREMSHTIDEIQYRLSPAHLKEEAKQRVRRAGVRTTRNTIDRVKSNPIGAALVGVGLWMLLRDNDSHDDEVYYIDRGHDFDRSHDHDHQMHAYSPQSEYRDFSYGEDRGGSGRVAEMKDRVGEAVDSARERVGETLGNVRGSASDMASRTMYGARSMTSRGRDVMTDSPLVAGVVGLALGALVGALIPETERENQLFGQHRDQLKERATEAVRDGVSQAKDIASTATNAAKEAVKNEVRS